MEKISVKGPCPECGQWKNRVMTVDAAVMEKGKILLIQRNNEPYKGYWALPGGYMDFDETAEQAALRELSEETGIKASKGQFFGLYSTPGRHPSQVVSAVYIVSEWDGIPAAGDDAGALEWFSIDNLPDSLAFDHKTIIMEIIQRS